MRILPRQPAQRDLWRRLSAFFYGLTAMAFRPWNRHVDDEALSMNRPVGGGVLSTDRPVDGVFVNGQGFCQRMGFLSTDRVFVSGQGFCQRTGLSVVGLFRWTGMSVMGLVDGRWLKDL